MKTKREIIERPNAMIQNRSTRPEFYQNEVENFMDEYAEEYAKAFFQWQRLSSAFYVSPDEAVEAFKNSSFFKESLKK